MSIVRLDPALALEFWDELRPYVLSALEADDYNGFTEQDILQQIEQGYARVLVVAEGQTLLGATLVTMRANPARQRQELMVVATAGENAEAWLGELRDELVDIARAEGCEAITLSGRTGWAKLAADHGFKVTSVFMALEVEQDGQLRKQQV